MARIRDFRRMRSMWVMLVLVLVSLAGCADESPPVEPEDTQEADGDLQATDDTGVIRGVVVDETIAPIAGVTIVITSVGAETTSLPDGSFGFSDLAPGSYNMRLTKLGFAPVTASATVEAGVDRPAVVRVQMAQDLESMPYSELLSFSGYLQCGVGIPGVGALNPCAFTGSVNVFSAGVQKPIDMTQIEMTWEGTNVLGDGLSIGILTPGTISNFARSDGPSPRILPVLGETIEGRYGEGYEAYTIRVFPGTTSPSVVIEQPFDIYVTHFYGFMASEGWDFLTQGEPIPPQ